MRCVMKTLVVCAAVALVCAPLPARADGYFSPWAGVNFGNTQAEGHRTFGVSAGAMGAGVFGGEFDFGYSPDFFGEKTLDNHALTAMANLIVGIPIGGTRGAGLRPYVTGGVGLIRTKLGPSDSNDAGFDLGGGVMGYFSDHVGLRGDVRFMRNFKDLNFNNLDLNVNGPFHFWRGSIGLVLR